MNQNITAHDILADLHSQLEKSKRTGDKLMARCPAHDDKTPSLSVTIGDNDCVVVHCFAGCPTEDVVAALGWEMRDLFAATSSRRAPVSSSVSVLDPSKLPGVPDPLPKGWGADDWDVPDGVNALEAIRDASHEARDIGDEADAATREASSLPLDTPGNVRLWIDALTDVDLDGQLRVLHLIAEAPEWAALVPALRIAVVGAIKGRTATSMAAAILGRFDDRTLAWRDPPGTVEDTSGPDVVSLATLLADPPDPTATVARGLAFGGTMGFIRGPKASGKTTILAAAAARVSRGQPWAGHPTEAGTVLVVCNDDPRSWTLALRDFGADPERILTARARVVSKPGKLAALLAEHRPTWVILDNLRTWCGAMQLDTDNSSAAADAIDPIAEAIRECGYPVACTVVHNEARSKGVTSDPYAGRMRNSTVFEDAADWIIGCAHADGSTMTTITAGEKTRREIPTETLIIDLDADGHGTPSTGGGGADPFTPNAPTNQLDEKIDGYLMAHPEGSSQKAVALAVGGRKQTIVARLKLLAVRDSEDKLYRHKGVPDEGVPIGGGEHGNTRVFPPVPPNGNRGGTGVFPCSHPNREQGSGTGSGTGVGNTDREHAHVDQPLAGVKTPPPPPLTGGSRNTTVRDWTLLGGDNEAKGGDAVKHEKSCPKCFGSGKDYMGDQCDYVRPIEPVEHTDGIKKWDDATSTWVDAVPNDDCWMVGREAGQCASTQQRVVRPRWRPAHPHALAVE